MNCLPFRKGESTACLYLVGKPAVMILQYSSNSGDGELTLIYPRMKLSWNKH